MIKDCFLITSIMSFVLVVLSSIPAYLTHIAWWVLLLVNDELDTMDEAVLAIVGTCVPLVGVVHGWTIWF